MQASNHPLAVSDKSMRLSRSRRGVAGGLNNKDHNTGNFVEDQNPNVDSLQGGSATRDATFSKIGNFMSCRCVCRDHGVALLGAITTKTIARGISSKTKTQM